ncbi:hypothetical protein F442_19527 [Phytophthora nicotianae P10297]|uniref:Uncharacterized protein n=1 Tax=Phytophthora nicotianae P10297 TaxID=1317064 RepID=W2YAG9_PHYNI|nr:hypothetical protein F442_19527 [Phytophthora nicotianae P10297]
MKVHDSRGSRATEALPSEDADSSFCKTQHQAEVASVATEDAETVNPVVASNLIEEAHRYYSCRRHGLHEGLVDTLSIE